LTKIDRGLVADRVVVTGACAREARNGATSSAAKSGRDVCMCVSGGAAMSENSRRVPAFSSTPRIGWR
jgi:hypothetical protein